MQMWDFFCFLVRLTSTGVRIFMSPYYLPSECKVSYLFLRFTSLFPILLSLQYFLWLNTSSFSPEFCSLRNLTWFSTSISTIVAFDLLLSKDCFVLNKCYNYLNALLVRLMPVMSFLITFFIYNSQLALRKRLFRLNNLILSVIAHYW